ncbi:MAG: GNAT family N-acetyltransferase [Actinomycetales bacterium]
MTSLQALLRIAKLDELDPLVRWSVDPSQVRHVVHEGNDLGLLRLTKDGKPWATVLGQDHTTAASLTEQLARHGFAGITSSAVLWPRLWSAWPGRGSPAADDPDVGLWSLWACRTADVEEHAQRSTILAPQDARITPLLAFSSSAHFFASDPRIVRWVGIEQDTALVAVAGQITAQAGAGEIVSVCTHPDYRGRGYAAACVRHLVMLARHEGVTTMILEAYTNNLPAAAVYRGVGFTEMARYASWELAHSCGAGTCGTGTDLSC